jgi:hypothetical protein
MTSDRGEWPIDQEDLRTQARHSRRQLREHLTALADIGAEVEELSRQVEGLRADAARQLAELEQRLARVEAAGAEREDWQWLQLASAIPIQMDLQMLELKHVIAVRDYLVRRQCPECQRPFLTRRAGRERQFCSDRCRVRAHRKGVRAEEEASSAEPAPSVGTDGARPGKGIPKHER